MLNKSEEFMYMYTVAMCLFAGFHVEESPNLITLETFPYTSEGRHLRIITEAADHFMPIGCYLLQDANGARVLAISKNSHNLDNTLREIFSAWIREDVRCSWEKLVECFRHCKLNKLAKEIEDAITQTEHSAGIQAFFID